MNGKLLAPICALSLAMLLVGCGPSNLIRTVSLTVEAEAGVFGIALMDARITTPAGGSAMRSYLPNPGPDFVFPVVFPPIDVSALSGSAVVEVDGLDSASLLSASGSANTTIGDGTNPVTVVLSLVGGELCGDGVANGAEACDGGDLLGSTCISLGFTTGVLACDATCNFNTAGCTGGGVCGDGTVDAGEACDDGNTADGDGCSSVCQTEPFTCGDGTCDMAGGETCTNCVLDCSGDPACAAPVCGDGTIGAGEDCEGADLAGQTCTSLGFTGGTLVCSASCAFDTSGCTGGGCGNGVLEPPAEACDGVDLGGNDCTTFGFTGGMLSCDGSCSFDLTGCNNCGNNTTDPGEMCDGSDLNGTSCASLGFGGGTLACAAACNAFDTSSCDPCGNNTIDAGETCDGSDLGGTSCIGLGFGGGTLACVAGCNAFDTSSCDPCGNNMTDPGETCDGSDLSGQTCIGLGFLGGTLACNATCTSFNTSGCSAMSCGNGTIEGIELCDGGNVGGLTCFDFGFGGGTLVCNGTCDAYDTSGCNPCGNNIIDAGEICDGLDLGGQDCISQGFLAGTLACNGTCTAFDTSSCSNLCEHDVCTTGTALDAAVCDPSGCVAAICAADPFCCATFWDSLCVSEVATDCPPIGSYTCPDTCPNADVCTSFPTPQALGCSPCVDAICAVDSFCCNVSWDGLCVNEVGTVCGQACP